MKFILQTMHGWMILPSKPVGVENKDTHNYLRETANIEHSKRSEVCDHRLYITWVQCQILHTVKTVHCIKDRQVGSYNFKLNGKSLDDDLECIDL